MGCQLNPPKHTEQRPPNCPKDAFLAIAWFEGVELLESHDGHSGTFGMAIKFQKSSEHQIKSYEVRNCWASKNLCNLKCVCDWAPIFKLYVCQ